MSATLSEGIDYHTEQPCAIGRIVYTVGARRYVALAFRFLDPLTDWRLSWLGPEGGDSSQLPDGILPSEEMLAALGAGEVVSLSEANPE